MAGFWKGVFTGILANITRDPALRGREGEHFAGHMLSKLTESEYRVHEDLMLPSNRGGTTQIDHVVFSRFGIFVVETKNYGGWIFAGENDRVWTQILRGGRKYKFQNPLRQNYGHIRALQRITGLPLNVFHNIVVFPGNSEFKTRIPKNTGYYGDLPELIRAYRANILTRDQVLGAINAVLAKDRQFDSDARRRHVRNLREKYNK